MPADPNLHDTHIEVITRMFARDEWLKHSEIIDQIMLYFETFGIKFGTSKAKRFLAHYKNNAMIVEDKTRKGYDKWRSGLVKNNVIKPNDDF